MWGTGGAAGEAKVTDERVLKCMLLPEGKGSEGPKKWVTTHARGPRPRAPGSSENSVNAKGWRRPSLI